jgi:hypothetical protein
MHESEYRTTKFVIVCEVLWQPASTHFSASQLVVDNGVHGTRRNVQPSGDASRINESVLSDRAICSEHARLFGSLFVVNICPALSEALHHIQTCYRDITHALYTSANW